MFFSDAVRSVGWWGVRGGGAVVGSTNIGTGAGCTGRFPLLSYR